MIEKLTKEQEEAIKTIHIDDNFFIERKSSIESSSVYLYLKKDSEFNFLKIENNIHVESHYINQEDMRNKDFPYYKDFSDYEEEKINDFKKRINLFYSFTENRFNELESVEYINLIKRLMDFCLLKFHNTLCISQEWFIIISGIIRNLKIKEIVNK